MKIRKSIIMLLFAILAGTIAMLAVANTPAIKNWLGLKHDLATEEDDRAGKKDPVQEALLKEMSGLLSPFDTANISFYVGGLLSAIDRTDSAHALTDLTYHYGKWGQELYVRMGETEMINGNGYYLFLDHKAKRLLLSPQKTLEQQSVLPIDQLYKYIRGEGFTVEKKSGPGKMNTIRIINPTHISLKGISLSYDSVSRQVKKIVIRQADIADHMNEHMEKWITLDINQWNDDPERNNYPDIDHFIEKINGNWQCKAPYKDYELTDQSIQ